MTQDPKNIPTPRTDTLIEQHQHSPQTDGQCYSEMKLFARTLERELTLAQQEIERLKDYNKILLDELHAEVTNQANQTDDMQDQEL